jgi:hypothetical protein
MGKNCPFCGMKHDKLLDSVTNKASKIAEEFTEKSFPKIWGVGIGNLITAPMNKEQLAKFMFETGATQMLTEYLMNELEDKCKNKD